MSYTPTTDFLALLRQEGNAVELSRMPGLDFLISAMSRAGLVSLWVSQAAPTVNLASTVWLKPAQPSWTAEGVVLLYDAGLSTFVRATPTLWAALLAAPSDYIYQGITASGVIKGNTTLLAITRSILAPTTTALQLPLLSGRAGKPLRIADWSNVIAEHTIQLTTPDGAQIMRRDLWTLYSTVDQLAGIALHPSVDLNGWVIA